MGIQKSTKVHYVCLDQMTGSIPVTSTEAHRAVVLPSYCETSTSLDKSMCGVTTVFVFPSFKAMADCLFFFKQGDLSRGKAEKLTESEIIVDTITVKHKENLHRLTQLQPMFRLATRAYATAARRPIPKPSEKIPTVEAFLSKIGRDCNEHKDHFPTWNSLFTTTSTKMKELGISVQQRKYILNQLEKFRQGQDIKHIKLGKKSFFGGERKRNERIGKLKAEERQERYAIEDAAK